MAIVYTVAVKTARMQAVLTALGASGKLDSLSITAGQTVTINTATITHA